MINIMNDNEKSKEELLHELMELRNNYGVLKLLYQKDIAECRKTEKFLTESELQSRIILELTTDYFFKADVDNEGNVDLNFISKNIKDITGSSFDESVPPDMLKTIIPPDDYEKFINYVKKLLKSSEPGEIECRTFTKSGKKRYISIISKPIKDTNNKVTSIIGAVKDITKRKQTEEEIQLKNIELAELNISKDKFFSIIANDLRIPITSFLFLTKLMSDNISHYSSQELHFITKELQDSATNLSDMLENLLEWSRLQRGIIEFHPVPFMLTFIVIRNLDVIIDFAKQKNIEIINNISEEFLVYADVVMFNIILRNLISNAIKFTPRGGKIEIGTVNISEGFTGIYIKDNGIGMDDQTVGKLFKMDQNFKRLGTENEPSSGLGLLICKEFIEKHNGRIWVESEEGKGSSFYFSLPNAE
jgi:PAS domain S-box-containing protein